MKLSVVIVNYNVKYFLEQALLSVQKSAEEMLKKNPLWNTEIFVVDNNSVDGSVDMVRNRFPQIHLIENKNNPGFAIANNQALRIAKGEFQLLLNPDTIVQEDTFFKCVEFMESYADAGGMGVMMLDGKGEFLPESKRGFPSPATAFYKICGLNKAFPKSKIFGKYHLGFLDKNQTHEVDVLAGAFMLLRKKTLDDIGLLDEAFFMYGEDIDLSYRILKGGYKNYYFPETKIIHYKGESTKKGSINYVRVFYKAMKIFAEKHLSARNAFLFSVLINIAISLRAVMAMILRIGKKTLLPLLDFGLMYAAMFVLIKYWEKTIKYIDGGEYPSLLYNFFVPAYIAGWMMGMLVSGGYSSQYKLRNILRGVVTGSLLIIVCYAFLPEHYRFSRAIILMGAGAAFLVFTITRFVHHYITQKTILFAEKGDKKIAIAGSVAEADRVITLLDKSRLKYNLIGLIKTDETAATENGKYMGNLTQLDEITAIYKPDEIIFCAKDIPSENIISWMSRLPVPRPDFKIVPSESGFVIGSNSKNEPGDYYSIDIKLAILHPQNILNKRIFDILASLTILLLSPFYFFKAPILKNIFSVLGGRHTLVSYSGVKNTWVHLPEIKKGILSPANEIKHNHLDDDTLMRLDYLYAKDYSVQKDFMILLKGYKHLNK